MPLTPEKIAEGEKWLVEHGFTRNITMWEKHNICVFAAGGWWFASAGRWESYGQTPEDVLREISVTIDNVVAVALATKSIVDEIIGPRKEASVAEEDAG